MPFTTTSFVFFFLPIVIILYYLINLFKKDIITNIYLIIVSLLFYSINSFDTARNLLIFITIVYLMGISLEKCKYYKIKFPIYLIILIMLLSYYKYATFIYESYYNIEFINLTFSDILIPLGISFIVFESISYLVDIYKKDAKSGNYVDTLLFFLFFPKITSGPIVLWRDFSKEVRNRTVSVDLFFSGLERIMIGFAKKTIIADSLGATLLNITTNLENGIDSITAIGGMILYFLQIYYDFAGYSDIAIGISRIFGFKFKENFNFPYTATTLSEFWRRWHISLGTWFREYIYIPLGGNRKNVYLNLFIVFIITGIWHGSTWNFVLWGLAHALFIMIERYVRKQNWYLRLPSIIKWFVVILFIMITWIIFMLPDLEDVKLYFSSILGRQSSNIYFTYEYFFTNKTIFIVILALIFAFIGKSKFFTEKLVAWTDNNIIGMTCKFMIYFVLFIISILFMINSSYSPFLYFQF